MKLHGYFGVLLADTVNLNQTRLDTLDTRVTAIMNYLEADAELGKLVVGSNKQGSWAHRTIIKPVKDKDEFDADVLLTLTPVDEWDDNPKEYLRAVRAAFKRSSTYKSMVTKKNRCVRVVYANDCHVDVVPHLVLSEDRQVIVNYAENAYEETNPEGFTAWMKEKDALAGGNLRKVIRLLKYVRDSKHTFHVPSVILTTLLGERVQVFDAKNRYSDLPTSLVNLMGDLAAWLELNPLMPLLVDPSCPQTSFNHRWDQDKYANFAKQMRCYADRMRAAYDEPDKTKSIDLWRAVFGDGFKAPAPTSSATVEKAASASIFERAPKEAFIEEMQIPFAGGRKVRIEARVRGTAGRRSVDLRKAGFARPGQSIDFTARTDTPAPYTVLWKVRNHGSDAKAARDLRGEIVQRGESIQENAKYRGRHYIEVWIVKDGRVVASDHHDVLIR